MTSFAIKLVGNTFYANSSNLPNTVPTLAANGYVQNVGPSPYGANTMNQGGVALGTKGGATFLYVVNQGTGTTNVIVANSSGVNIGTFPILSNAVIYLVKGPYETINCANNSNTVSFTPIAKLT